MQNELSFHRREAYLISTLLQNSFEKCYHVCFVLSQLLEPEDVFVH